MSGFYCSLVSLDLTGIGEGFMNLTDAPYDVVYNGHTYRAFGTLLAVDKITVENTLASKELGITLSGVSMEFQEVVNEKTFRRSPIRIYKAFVAEGGNTVTEASIYYRGFTSTPETQVDYKSGSMALKVSCKSIFDLDKKPSLCRANNASHQAYHSGDKFFMYANQDLKDDALWYRK
ncbi:hypothetical protein BA746_00380 [Vibrio parahaemolyticus]|uniref:hypothetical protein n=1 Tax=Vibrio parahaemolyticus TaxID=670 RepID=UPI0006A5C2A2|nr:hypothetical protein [Vibrio parahaemolyticus]EIE5875896.1 hypothetical protein [Vibrio parahaemolyticus]KOF30958.1 hypothetical protein ACX04_15985 [Vibrio parahaemolyticus]OTW07825.1 hypothetical protein BA743_16375 [Vibrio parahaemolyticus]OTW23940.1 hypothetical protein BA744_01000 [Vibrio parahaemolyticus]OTW27250.1 hypothetical protein BA746_00380 [Vibrio parahaemolyticus]